jgi:hypothetical protein
MRLIQNESRAIDSDNHKAADPVNRGAVCFIVLTVAEDSFTTKSWAIKLTSTGRLSARLFRNVAGGYSKQAGALFNNTSR